jgi:hypothetical protein
MPVPPVRLCLLLIAAGLSACTPSMWRSDYLPEVPPGAAVYLPGAGSIGALKLDGVPVGEMTFATVDAGIYAYQFAPAAQQLARPVFVQVSCADGLVLAAPFPAGAPMQGQIARCADSPIVAKPLYKPS